MLRSDLTFIILKDELWLSLYLKEELPNSNMLHDDSAVCFPRNTKYMNPVTF